MNWVRITEAVLNHFGGARQSRSVETVFIFLDVLLGGSALVAKPHHPFRLHRQDSPDNEADMPEELSRMPFDPGVHPTFPALGRRLILEAALDTFNLYQRMSPQ